MSDQGELARLRHLLMSAYEGGAWHGPSVLEVLEGVSAEQAAARPLRAAHSIWELTGHMIYWRRAAAAGLTGAYVDPNPPPEQNFPVPDEPTEGRWEGMRLLLEASQQALVAALDGLDPARLDDPVTGRDYPVFTLIHGAIHHDLYHAGQIALLKKAPAES